MFCCSITAIKAMHICDVYKLDIKCMVAVGLCDERKLIDGIWQIMYEHCDIKLTKIYWD